MKAWVQKGFALISDICPAGMPMPLFHTFHPASTEVEYELRKAQADLPDNLKINIRMVDAELHFEG
jgi:hypothetical protein